MLNRVRADYSLHAKKKPIIRSAGVVNPIQVDHSSLEETRGRSLEMISEGMTPGWLILMHSKENRMGVDRPLLDWRERLVCSRCGSRQVDMVARVKCARSPLLPPLQ
jgi:hypothetical protein